jgi:hypothetical protein
LPLDIKTACQFRNYTAAVSKNYSAQPIIAFVLRETTELAGGDSDIKLICCFTYLFRSHIHFPGKLECGGAREFSVYQGGLHLGFKFATHGLLLHVLLRSIVSDDSAAVNKNTISIILDH